MSYTLHLTAEEVLNLDDYLTRKVGYIGWDGPADEAMQELARQIAATAEHIRVDIEVAASEAADDEQPATTD